MLHIILVILKIAGILLAAILLLILAVLLLLLFAPLRYEISARYQKEERQGKGRVTWLFHLISFQAAYEFRKGPEISLKIFGRKLFPKTREEEKKKTAKPARKSGISSKKPAEPQKSSDKKPIPPPVMQEDKQQKPHQPVISGDIEETPFLTPKKGIFAKIKDAIQKLRSILLGVQEKIRQIMEKLRQLCQKISDIREKIQHYLDIWQAEETKLLRGCLWKYLCYILRHYRPRKIKGFLKYGFEDPSVTGQLTGILYILKPLAFEKFELQPEFETSSLILEGDVDMKGHIRLVHLAYVAIRLLFDKNLKYVIRRIKE